MNYSLTNFEVLAWLQEILYERFGNNLLLSQAGPQILRISLRERVSFVEIVTDCPTFNQASSDIPCGYWDARREGWSPAINGNLPAPGARRLDFPLVQKSANGFRINYDILGLIYWCFNRQEEFEKVDLDIHGRFSSKASHAYKNRYLDRPVVDEWLEILAQVIQKAWPDLQLPKHRFCVKVSHDVDRPSRYGFSSPKKLVRQIAGDVFKRNELLAPVLGPWIRLNSKKTLNVRDKFNTFEWLMDVSDQEGLTSAFYFICGRTDAAKDADYELEDPPIRALLRRIHARGHEIGLHPSYNSYLDEGAVKTEARRLKRVCAEEGIMQKSWGGRMHYLRWQSPTTLVAWEQAGMNYESTLTYADTPGFRCGTCFEYPGFDSVRNRRMNIRVRPLIAMESTVMASTYLGLGYGEAAFNKFAELKNACRAVGGCFTLLWHNSEFTNYRLRELYKHVLMA